MNPDNPSILDLTLNPYNELEELSIEDELSDFISGKDFGIEKYVPYIHKALKRDKYGTPGHCTCWDKFANEGRDDCPYCDGIGYYWKETVIPAIMFLLNKRNIVKVLNTGEVAGREGGYETAIITRHTDNVMQTDRIIVPHLDDNGFFQHPYKEEASYYVKERKVRRLDLGRKEYDFSVISKVI